MALWICARCSAAYAVGAPGCPQCQCTDYLEADPMPKITVHGGATNADDTEAGDASQPVGEPGPELAAPAVVPEPAAPADDTSTTASKRTRK